MVGHVNRRNWTIEIKYKKIKIKALTLQVRVEQRKMSRECKNGGSGDWGFGEMVMDGVGSVMEGDKWDGEKGTGGGGGKWGSRGRDGK